MLNRFQLPSALALLFAAGAATAQDQTPEAKGLEIALEAERRDTGFGDSRADLTMTLTNRGGQTSTRELGILTLEVPDPEVGDKSLVSFDKPREVKGTALLSHSKILDPDDQWLFLPALKRVKRISSVNKSGPFMGSEFSFEDMASPEVAKYSYVWLRDEPCNVAGGDMTCFVVARTPLYEHSGYTKIIGWVDTEEYRMHKLEFYDRRGDLLKTLALTDYRQYLDKYWRAHDLFMENHKTGKTTRLNWSAYEMKTGLSESDFTQARLKRGR